MARDVVGIEGVAETEQVGQKGRAQKRRPLRERCPRPGPRRPICCEQQGIDHKKVLAFTREAWPSNTVNNMPMPLCHISAGLGNIAWLVRPPVVARNPCLAVSEYLRASQGR